MSCTKIGKGSSADLEVGRQTIIEVRFIIQSNPTNHFCHNIVIQVYVAHIGCSHPASRSSRVVCFSVALQENTKLSLSPLRPGLEVRSQELSTEH